MDALGLDQTHRLPRTQLNPGNHRQPLLPFVSAGKKNGLGLGLALARQTVLDHGGDMWAESEPGQGACFRLRLPAGK